VVDCLRKDQELDQIVAAIVRAAAKRPAPAERWS
jgi:hypothetical protein